MLDNVFTVSQQVIVLFITIGLGFFLSKIGFIKEDFIKGLTKFVISIVTPFSIVVSFQREFNTELVSGLLISVGLAIGINTLFILLSFVLIRMKDESQNGVLRFAATFGNAGYMGLPLQQAILGSIGVFYGAVYVAVFHAFVWSFGVVSISGDKKELSAKKMLLSPPLVAVVIGIALFVSRITIPELILKPIKGFGDMNSTLPMIIIGFYLAQTDFKKLFRTGALYIGIVLRLILYPLIAIGVLMLLGIRGDLMVSSVIPFCAPSAAITTMLAAAYGKNTDLSVGMVSVTTICAIATMPLIIALGQMLAY